MRVEVAVLGSNDSLIVIKVSVDVKQHLKRPQDINVDWTPIRICVCPLSRHARTSRTPSTGLQHPSWRKVPESDARSVGSSSTTAPGLVMAQSALR